MIIDNLNDLEIIKNALENYISNGKKALREAKEVNLNPMLIDIINDSIVGAERLLKDAEKEHINSAYKKAKNLIDNEDVEKTGKKEFIERMMAQIPEDQEIKLATLELDQNNEDITKENND
ncbi:hypothetical protein NPD5_3872 [Clostridium sporogenes]|uniref:Uncharacterized protein n=1 Tax=Clostridium sporogenes TaxID=1509 RepID=A0A1L3NG25_CLOSG|nr:hypothetical protein [Clostridium sporogenes]APH15074.1 hypothetical protein NPD5_3872 [Clostridium sporogenes]